MARELDTLLAEAKDAIEAMNGDMSATTQELLTAYEDVAEDLEVRINALRADVDNCGASNEEIEEE